MNIKGAALLTGFIALLGFEGGGAVYAGKVELTTYYPAPVGEYNTLKAKQLTTGDNLPDRDGDILLKPQTGDPATWTANTNNIGQFAYSQSEDALYHSNGSAWLPAGGTTGTVMTLACVTSHGYFQWISSSADLYIAPCTVQNCPTGWTSVATYDEPIDLTDKTVGRRVRVCTK